MQRKRLESRSVWKGILGVVLAAALAAGGIWYLLFYVNQFELKIALEGAPEQQMEYGEPYVEPGAWVLLRGTMFFRDGIVLPMVQAEAEPPKLGQLGEQEVHYSAVLGPWRAEARRKLRIRDTQSPVIQLAEDPGETILPGMTYQEPGFTATDNYDGDITDRVRRREEYGKIIYSVVDSSGNPAVAEREIPYYDGLPPEIFLIGSCHYAMNAGVPFVEPGYSALDNVDGDITDKTLVEGEVQWWKSGAYPVVYAVQDEHENGTTLTREVQVRALPHPQENWPQERTIYLTFDDGPGPYTMALLNVLDRYNVKATFFVTNSGYDEVMGQIVARGHSIGIHTVSHDYSEIYSSEERFFNDLLTMRRIILENTGVETSLMRFPGGSSNEVSRRFTQGIMTALSQEVLDAGYQYFDWNVDSDDAGRAKTAEKVYENVVEGVRQHRVSIVLQHDIHDYSVDAVEKIIRWGKNNGYQFRSLELTSPACHHDVRN